MRAYLSTFRLRFITNLQYRSAAWAGIATQFCWGFMLVALYEAFYRSGGGDPAMTLPQLTTYIWLQQAFLALVMLWAQDGQLLNDIASGQIAYEMCRPVSLYGFWFARLFGSRLANVALRFAPVLLIASLVPAPYGLMPPPNLLSLAMFLISIVLAGILAVAISMYIYILTFKTLSPAGSRFIVTVFADFLSGATLPLPLMPQIMQKIANFLPFRYTFDLPFRIYSGNLYGMEALAQLGVQLLWIALLAVIGYYLLRAVLTRAVIQGG